jgi:hypothetical protein
MEQMVLLSQRLQLPEKMLLAFIILKIKVLPKTEI